MRNAREIAFEILYDVFQNNAYSNIAIDKALKREKADKAFVSTIVYGVIERKITLDYLINPFLSGRIKPKLKLILYIGAYQLYFMDRIPESVAVNETVELAKSTGHGFYKDFINAVLHKMLRNKVDIDSIDDLSIKYSCPSHLINMWTKMYGEEDTKSILDNINGKPPVYAIPNNKYVNADELLYELNDSDIYGEIVDDAVMITSRFDLSRCRAFENGLFYIEDLSSYKCAKALGAQDNDIVFDMCAAPGGKAFTISQQMHQTGSVYAFDLHRHRVALIKESADRLELNNIEAYVNDALVFNERLPKADRILCDVPCSGFGIIRRKPEIRYKDLDSIKDLPEIQYNILKTSSKYLKSGGRIMYSTCTLNKKENEKVVSRFLEDNPEFCLIEQRTSFPSQTGGDGFYWALMEKNND